MGVAALGKTCCPSKNKALSKDDYGWLLFVASYLIGLIVMVSVNYLMQKLRKEDGTKP